MPTTTYTQEQVTTLKAAIAAGTVKVEYADKKVTYRSLDEMQRILGMMETELGRKTAGGNRRFATFNKGLDAST